MELGAFSVSLAVKDMAVSRAFYSKLGFKMVAGDGETWTIVANRSVVVGLFQGMLEGNILTFNPGWEGLGNPVEDFADIRDLSSRLNVEGLEPADDATGEKSSGPASFTLTDPDGNAILFDQHV
jgi:catechol 2,3-dioxygenase-like lactoylglutathione lyase family enzyme